ncbi:hypothetical protein C1I98_00455 [Spongiactinospora gelatinilytica]|uniref:Phytase-like domain-containing protein n=1 Tax=Spongiactinospora gelatinilytica TaxID=2666298 RepID=A0A2W2IFR9_9ACTN|nr:hypothetical protein C1I98_00455 [Spongiactinospora gelatinilytica]
MQYLTAYYPMKEIFPVAEGGWVLITAASGGTGLGAIRIAKLLGARVIATNFRNRLYEFDITGAEDILKRDSLSTAPYKPVTKRLVHDFGLNENLEALAFGPKLNSGECTLIVGADNDFARSSGACSWPTPPRAALREGRLVDRS